LIRHGASVHETIGGETLTTLNLFRKEYQANTVISFFRLLSTAGYSDFNLMNNHGFSALLNALRSPTEANSTIDFLANIGAPISKVDPSGRSALHVAAELCTADVVEHLYTAHSLTNIDRPDRYGCVPLHYALFKIWVSREERDNRTVKFLLRKGADVGKRGKLPAFMVGCKNGVRNEYTPGEYAAALGPEVLQSYMGALMATMQIEDEEDAIDENFYDALEVLAED